METSVISENNLKYQVDIYFYFQFHLSNFCLMFCVRESNGRSFRLLWYLLTELFES